MNKLRKITVVLLLALMLGGCGSEALPSADKEYDLKILFVGNSYTSANDLPKMFEKLAESGDKTIYQSSSTQDSSTLFMHADPTDSLGKKTIGKIENDSIDWDYVVLQEQSILPIVYHPYFSLGVEDMAEVIEASDAKMALYMTWGRRDGYEDLSFQEMNDELEAAYEDEADLNDALLLPVAAVWGELREEDEEFGLKLWQDDGSHPSYMGSYLNACVFYAAFFDESPVGLWYDSKKIEAKDAETVQTYVKDFFEL